MLSQLRAASDFQPFSTYKTWQQGWNILADFHNFFFKTNRHHSASASKLHWWCSTVLAADVRSTYGDVYTPIHAELAAPLRLRSSLGLAAAVSEQTFTAQTLGNSLNVVSRAGYLSVCTAGGASDRHWLKACLINRLTYLLVRVLVFSGCIINTIFAQCCSVIKRKLIKIFNWIITPIPPKRMSSSL